MKVLIQIGYRRVSRWSKEGQLVKAWVNDERCTWDADQGKWLTPFSEATAQGWFYWQGDLEPEDIIKLEIKTSLAGKGVDERRTLNMLFEVDETVSVKEIAIQGVGKKGYPILKGRVREIANVSKADEREQEIEMLMVVKIFLRRDFENI